MRGFFWLIGAIAIAAAAMFTPSLLDEYRLNQLAMKYAKAGDNTLPALAENLVWFNAAPVDGALVCTVDSVRLILLERTDCSHMFLNMTIAGETPDQSHSVCRKCRNHFKFEYADGRAVGLCADLTFVCEGGEVHVSGQSFRHDQPALVILNTDNEIILAFAGDELVELRAKAKPMESRPIVIQSVNEG